MMRKVDRKLHGGRHCHETINYLLALFALTETCIQQVIGSKYSEF